MSQPVSANLRGHENIEWSTSYAFHLTDANKDLPRVLLVGDSIVGGYCKQVTALLEGKMNVTYWASSYCMTSPCYMRMLSVLLDEAQYEVIHFNNGCHSLSTPNEDWEKGLRRAFAIIKAKQPKAKLVWCSTTPNRNLDYDRKIQQLNAVAEKVVKETGGITIDDLYSLMAPLDRNANWTDNFHFKPSAIAKQAEQVSKACQ